MIHRLRTSLIFLALMTLLLGLIYPCAVWFVGTLLFPYEAAGSLVFEKGKIVGSELIAQPFTSNRYFWPRPSATTGGTYQFLGSGGSNLNPSNPLLLNAVESRIELIKQADKPSTPIPVDLVTASGSGLDPHITPEAASLQIERIAAARNLDPQMVRALLQSHIEERTFGFIGERRVNVLNLNLALEHLPEGGR